MSISCKVAEIHPQAQHKQADKTRCNFEKTCAVDRHSSSSASLQKAENRKKLNI